MQGIIIVAQHFLLSPLAINLTAEEVWLMTDEEVHDKFKRLRWQDGIPTCPKCGSQDAWAFRCGRKWKCRGKRVDPKTGSERWCYYQYTVTTQTHLHSRKRSLKQILASTLNFIGGVMGFAALHQRRHIKNAYKTPFVFQHRIRAAIDIANKQQMEAGPFMEGEVEIDGMFVTGKKVKQKQPIFDEKELEIPGNAYRLGSRARKTSGWK